MRVFLSLERLDRQSGRVKNNRQSHDPMPLFGLNVIALFQAIDNMNSQSSYVPSSTGYQSSSTTDQPTATMNSESTAKSTITYPSSSMTGRGPSSALDSSQATSATFRGDPMRRAVHTERAPPPLPFFSQAIVCNGMVYCSGQIGTSPVTKQLVDGGVGDRTVGLCPSAWN